MASSNPATDLSQFIAQIAPTLVNQRGTESTNTTVAPEALSMSDLAFMQAMNMATSSQDALVANIFKRATMSFAPTLAEEHTSGVYNSTTQAQLQNEALARATGEAADAVLKAQAAGTQTAAGVANNRVNSQRNTDTKTQKQPSLGSKAGTIATSVIASQLARKGINKLGDLFPKGSLWNTGDSAAVEAAGGGSAAVDAAGVAATQTAIAGAEDAGAVGLGDFAAGAAGAEGADALAEAAGFGAGAEGVSAAELGGSLGADAGVDAAGSAATDTAIASAEAAPEETATALGLGEEAAGLGLVETGIGGAVGLGVAGSIAGEGGALSDFSGGTPGAVLGSAAAGDAEGAVENLATGGVSGVVDTVKENTGWIVCTELQKQGRMPLWAYREGAKVFLRYSEFDKTGYYIWAKPLTQHLQQHPYSHLSVLTEIVMNKRARYLAGEKSLSGFFCTHTLFLLCWSLARILKGKECLRLMKI